MWPRFIPLGAPRRARKSELLWGQLDGAPVIAKRVARPNPVWEWYRDRELAMYRAFAEQPPGVRAPRLVAADGGVLIACQRRHRVDRHGHRGLVQEHAGPLGFVRDMREGRRYVRPVGAIDLDLDDAILAPLGYARWHMHRRIAPRDRLGPATSNDKARMRIAFPAGGLSAQDGLEVRGVRFALELDATPHRARASNLG
jgi:hypothetical protein